jgi:prepilin-type N-terminal cleavage/methylation domain-containing protein
MTHIAPNARERSRRGTTLLELMLALGVLAVLAGIIVLRTARFADALAARGAAREVRAALGTTRHLAVLRATRAAVGIDTVRGVVVVHLAAETALVRGVRAAYGVRISTSRDSLAWGADGLGWGAANAKLVIRRGVAAETITVSRLGRVR